MPRISTASKTEILNRLDALAIVGEYVRLEKAGGVWKGCCPFHNEKTPSFTVNPDKKLYYCFGCQKGGDIINFIMDIDKLSFGEAMELLAKKTGVAITYDAAFANDDKELRHKEELAELYRRVALSFQYFLTRKDEGAAALCYVRERGFTDATIEQFRLGYAPADGRWLFGFLSQKGYSPAFLAESGLFSRKIASAAFFRNRLVIPIAGRDGKILAFGGRVLPPDDGPKYLNSPDSALFKKGQTLFALDLALDEIRKRKEAIICEGYLDVMALHQAGVRNAVAPLGTAFTPDQARLLARWAERVQLLFDQDNAGQNAAVKAILTCRRGNLECRVITLPRGEGGQTLKDPADILKAEGPGVLAETIKNSILDLAYLCARSKALHNQAGTVNKAAAIAYLFPFLETFDSEIERGERVKQVADAFGAAPEAVQKDYAAYLAKNSRGGERPANPPAAADADGGGEQRHIRMNDELYLLGAVFAHCDAKPELFSQLRATLPIEEFSNSDAKELYLTFEETLRGGAFTTEALLSALKDQALKNFLLSKCAGGEFAAQPEQLVHGGIKRIRVKRLKQKRADLITEMRIAKNGGRDVDDLLAEKMFIDEMLLELEQ
ncbi:MAG: DNA primase [Spirochaetaceae bacterium]|nr:DNA primase [Spirochaetaceae bacterium]